jgi:hypothetical protein
VKNLGKTIDSLIRIDPDFEEKLKPIKNKWRRWPYKTMEYWAELLEILNTNTMVNHPQREEIRDAINTKTKRKHKLYSFDTILPGDKIIGNIPDNIADKIRRQDHRSIDIAKLRVEADLTRNLDLMADLVRRDFLLEIETKKVWVILRDHFKLWKRAGSYNIRSKDGVLFLVMPQVNQQAKYVKPGVLNVNPELLKRFFRYMGLDLPPDLQEGDK